LSEKAQAGKSCLNTLNAVLELFDVAAEFLAKSERGRILKVGATDFDYILELVGLGMKSILQLGQSGDKGLVNFHNSSDMHNGGEAERNLNLRHSVNKHLNSRVVAALAHVNMVVRVYWLLRAELTTEDFNGAV
jgi:hypothetical protein